MKQVDKSHYDYFRYQTPERFSSYYYGIKAVMEVAPETLLEIGVGDGLFLNMVRHYGIDAYGMDIDSSLGPSLCGSVLQIPLCDGSVDCTVALQVLEHLPFEKLSGIASELFRVSKSGVIISLPEQGNTSFVLRLPYVRPINILIPNFFPFHPKHRFDGEHYWEINKRGFPLSRVIQTFDKAGLKCRKTWINPFHPYHRFFIFDKNLECQNKNAYIP